MGTAVTITLGQTAPDGETMRTAISSAIGHLHDMEALFSTFRPTSDISRINDEHLPRDQAHPFVREVLSECQRLKTASSGAFDHEANGLDPAGYVKGWAVQGAADHLERAGLDHFIIWAGGDILARTPEHAPHGWRVGIRHPADPAICFTDTELRNNAVATSGVYERGNHIVRRNDHDLTSVSIVGPDLGTADALATALMSTGVSNTQWLALYPEYHLIALDSANTIHTTRTPSHNRRPSPPRRQRLRRRAGNGRQTVHMRQRVR